MDEKNCIFCKISKGEINSQKIYEGNNFFAIHDVNPKVKGHALVISKSHFKTILELPDILSSELLECIKKTSIKLMKENNADGFNVLNNNFKSAGQIVEHLHFHILPRKKDDNVKIIS